jgi:hypothetical protein
LTKYINKDQIWSYSFILLKDAKQALSKYLKIRGNSRRGRGFCLRLIDRSRKSPINEGGVFLFLSKKNISNQ